MINLDQISSFIGKHVCVSTLLIITLYLLILIITYDDMTIDVYDLSEVALYLFNLLPFLYEKFHFINNFRGVSLIICHDLIFIILSLSVWPLV